MRGIVANYYTRTARIFMYDLPKDVTGGEGVSLEIMNKARDEMAEAGATIEDDPYSGYGFAHIRLSPDRAQYYSERLRALIDDVLHETPDPDGSVYGIFVAMFMSPPYMQGPSTTSPSDAV